MNFGPAPVNAEGAGDGPRRTCEVWGDGAGGGASQKALKKLYGARLGRPAASTVEIQPMGRGATMALNGACGRPCRWRGS